MEAVDLLEGGVGDVNLSQLSQLINRLLEARTIVDDISDALKEAKEIEKELEERLIPDVMGGMAEIVLDNGYRVKLKRKVRASIAEAAKEEVFEWMDKEGHGDLIKAAVQSQFSRSDLEQAKELVQTLQDQGFASVLKQSVHWATLDKWVVEQQALGMELPESITTFEVNKVEVKRG